MKYNYLFLSFLFVNGENIIKNVKTALSLPLCRNCVYYKPENYFGDFDSTFSKCEKFSKKIIITNSVMYSYADSSRKDESKCGKEGKYFEEEKDIKMKIVFFHLSYILTNFGYFSLSILLFITILLTLHQ